MFVLEKIMRCDYSAYLYILYTVLSAFIYMLFCFLNLFVI